MNYFLIEPFRDHIVTQLITWRGRYRCNWEYRSVGAMKPSQIFHNLCFQGKMFKSLINLEFKKSETYKTQLKKDSSLT